MSSWDDIEKRAEEAAKQGGIFVRLKDGESVVGLFCGEPHSYETVWTGKASELYDEQKHAGMKPTLRIALNFFTGGAMKVIDLNATTFRKLCQARHKYGLDKLFEVSRHGNGVDTEYSILLEPDGAKLSEATGAVKKAELHDLEKTVRGGGKASSGNGSSVSSSGKSMPQLIDEATKSQIISFLKPLGQPAVQKLLGELGVKRVGDIRVDQLKQATAILDSLKPASSTEAEIDPFA